MYRNGIPKNKRCRRYSATEQHQRIAWETRACKKSLAHLKTVFQTFSWPDDSTAIRAIEHTADKFRTLKSKKADFEIQSLRETPLFSSSRPTATTAPPLDEAPPCTTPEKCQVPPVGRPAKRLSDGTCKRTAEKYIDEVVDCCQLPRKHSSTKSILWPFLPWYPTAAI